MVTAIVLAAGRSTRMGGGPNKQFIELLGRPIVYYSLAAFQECGAVDAIVLVRHPDYAQQAEQIVHEFGFKKVVALTNGGVERQNSVWNGLEQCHPATEIVAVHDGRDPWLRPH